MKRVLLVGCVVALMLIPGSASARQAAPMRGGHRINCAFSGVHVRSASQHLDKVTGYFKLINSSYRYNYTAEAKVYVYSPQQSKHKHYQHYLQSRTYKKYHFTFYIRVAGPGTTVHWTYRQCGVA